MKGCPIPDRQPLQLSLNFFYVLLDAVGVAFVCAKGSGQDRCPCLWSTFLIAFILRNIRSSMFPHSSLATRIRLANTKGDRS